MNNIIPYEIQSIIIINFIEYNKYNNIRLVCMDWNFIVEKTDYSEVIKFTRMLNSKPIFIQEMDIHNIVFKKGVIFSRESSLGNFIYNDEFNKLENINSVRTINHKHGKIEIFYNDGNSYVIFNNTKFDLNLHGVYPRLLNHKDKLIINVGHDYLYEYKNGKWNKYYEINNAFVYIKNEYKYEKYLNTISIVKDNIMLNSVDLTSYIYGFDYDKFLLYDSGVLKIWNLN